MPKGGAYERDICKQLSKWWSGGKRDDIFWRSSQSGGRATQRAKKGKPTYGSYGDITAVHPVGGPLLKLFTIELKRGKSHGTPGDLEDLPPNKRRAIRPFEKTLAQAMRSAEQASSYTWMVISRRDSRVSMVYTSWRGARLLQDALEAVHSRYEFDVRIGRGKVQCMRCVGVRLQHVLDNVQPARLKAIVSKQ